MPVPDAAAREQQGINEEPPPLWAIAFAVLVCPVLGYVWYQQMQKKKANAPPANIQGVNEMQVEIK